MADLFKDVIPAVMKTKEHVITEENEKDYVPFVVNRALSYHRDCVFYANQMNMLPNTPEIMQFHYLLNSVRAWKRPFQPWQKLEKNKDLESIMEYYDISPEKAKDVLKLLPQKEIEKIHTKLNKGGLKK